jgi:hypothetical protein
LRPTARINRENYDLIRDGMTEQEVVAILGEESWSYEFNYGKSITMTWFDGSVTIDVIFEEHCSFSKSFGSLTAWQKLINYVKWD